MWHRLELRGRRAAARPRRAAGSAATGWPLPRRGRGPASFRGIGVVAQSRGRAAGRRASPAAASPGGRRAPRASRLGRSAGVGDPPGVAVAAAPAPRRGF